ncbi:MAG: AAA family ATPase, partial [Lachnospiraceae bacterium]|nr:AAA family ATPase [Lachnospiraceae bacterium]
MAVCLNVESSYKMFQMMVRDKYFVDKSGLIEIVNARINTMNRYLCVTKPRRFGKTSVLNMLGAYYCRMYDSEVLFDGLNISKSVTFREHLNRYNVLDLRLNRLPDHGGTYDDYVSMIRDSIKRDIQEAYPWLENKEFGSVTDMLSATGDQFIFIIDEWDYIFSHELYPEHYGDFLEFLRNLLKDQPYVALAYMTGVLPIKKYSTGSALNMFKEYTMLKDPHFEEYFGFTESEVITLCGKQSVLSMEEISDWYDGYQTKSGARLYNPRSVICALEDAVCQSYWTRTGKMD